MARVQVQHAHVLAGGPGPVDVEITGRAGTSALVTGGGSGIGRASALALAAEGALVTVAGRTAETLKETVRLAEASGGSARYVVADVTDESQVEKAVQAAVADIGRLDFALNNAGYDGEYQLTKDYSTEMLDHMIALNVRGVFLSMKHELRHMTALGSGAIVNMTDKQLSPPRRTRLACVQGLRGIDPRGAAARARSPRHRPGCRHSRGRPLPRTHKRLGCTSTPSRLGTPLVSGHDLPVESCWPHPGR
ncbi:SDR family NAD(P)-dependent oxidoreductase [Streptomyces sp. NPDC059881]|uniref:SDR family NAD(P)-dependent oxidoreductase n=1 Tax=Streptomyces sp. NPDC059881 TaxID=3346986 RepID=UPI003665482D